MCNCGCDISTKDEADKLRKKAAVTAAGAACLAGIPAAVTSAAHPHPAVLWTVIAVQLVLIAKALRLIVKRKQLLQST